MADKKRYEYKSASSNKFWEVEDPFTNDGKSWLVRVHFGRIGTAGQNHFNVFWSPLRAQIYYAKKVHEKLTKGYKFVSLIKTKPDAPKPAPASKNPILIAQAPTPVPICKPKECEHLQLRKTGDRKWQCNACKTHIEFDKPQTVAGTVVEEITQVRRFIDLSALRG